MDTYIVHLLFFSESEPKTIISTYRLFGWMVRSGEPSSKSELLGATLEIQRTQAAELMEQRMMRQQQVRFHHFCFSFFKQCNFVLSPLQIFYCMTPPNLSAILVAHDQYSHEQKSNTNKIDVVVRTLLKDDLECKIQNDLKASEHVG